LPIFNQTHTFLILTLILTLDPLHTPLFSLPSPAMSLVTYILLSALHSGLSSQFHPEVLGRTASKALGVVLLEFIAIKLGTYLLDVRGSSATGVGGSLEMGMYGGYKFVGIILTLVVSLVTRSRGVWWVTFLYTVAANAFFLVSPPFSLLAPFLNSPSSGTADRSSHRALLL
jgi:hypothetical protein